MAPSVVWIGSFLAAYVIGEALGLKGKEEHHRQRKTYGLFRLLNYLSFFGFAWSTAHLAMNLRTHHHLEESDSGTTLLVKLVWVASLLYFFAFFGVTFVDKDETVTDNEDTTQRQESSQKGPGPSLTSKLRSMVSALVANLCMTHLCMNIAFDVVCVAPIVHAIKLVFGLSIFHKVAHFVFQYWTEPLLMTPLTWSNSRVFIDNRKFWEESKEKGNLLTLTNHGSRVDWLVGMFIGSSCGHPHRVGFIMDSVMKYMPFIGWLRYLLHLDLYIQSNFVTDKHEISRTIDHFKEHDTEVLYFISPEGHIADPNTLSGDYYVTHCQHYAESQGFEPLHYLLTPRTKGMSVLSEHVHDRGSVATLTMAFEQNGRMLNEQLLSSDRVVPDLYTLFDGIIGAPTDVFIQAHGIHFTPTMKCDDVRKVMFHEYQNKDQELAFFHSHGRFKNVKREDMEQFRCNHSLINATVVAHNVALIAVTRLLGLEWYVLAMASLMFASLLVNYAASHLMVGHTMEALPFESIAKAFMTYKSDCKIKEIKFRERLNEGISDGVVF